MPRYGLTLDLTLARVWIHKLRGTVESDPTGGCEMMPGLLPIVITLHGTAQTLSEKIDKGTQEDAPLSDHGGGSDGDQEIMSGDDRDDRDEEVMGTNPRPAATNTALGPGTALIVALEAAGLPETPLLGNPADRDVEKACWDAFQLLMQGFYMVTRTLLNSYQDACREVETIVQKVLQRSHGCRPYFCVGGFCCYSPLGEEGSTHHGLHGRKSRGTDMAAAKGAGGREGGYRGHPGLTVSRDESLSHPCSATRGHPFPGSGSHLCPYREGH